MTSYNQTLESYLPVYDTVPEAWPEARPFFVEQLKRIANAVNAREIGWYVNEEVISGKQFQPSNVSTGTFRSILRKSFTISPVVAGTNTIVHGINISSNFTLIHLYVSLTNDVLKTGISINASYNATSITFSAGAAYSRGVIVIEYMQEG